jgi:hypothetical protein
LGQSWFTSSSAHVKPEDCRIVDYVASAPKSSHEESSEPNEKQSCIEKKLAIRA